MNGNLSRYSDSRNIDLGGAIMYRKLLKLYQVMIFY